MKRKSILHQKKSRAQSLVEFALVLPLLLLVVYGLLEVGRLIFTYSIVISAAREAARYGSATGLNTVGGTQRYKDCAGIRAAAQNVDFLGVIDDANISITYDKGPGTGSFSSCPPSSVMTGDRIYIQISANFTPIITMPIGPITVRSSSARTVIVSLAVAGTALPPPTVAPPPGSTKIIGVSGDINFGGVTINQTVTSTVVITNSGTGTLTISSISVPTGFTADWTSGTIPPGGSQTVTISFTPTSATTYSGTIIISSDKTGGTNTVMVSGTGLTGSETPTPTGTTTGLPTYTFTPSMTWTPSPTFTSTFTPTNTATAINCTLVTHGPLLITGKSMYMQINNGVPNIMTVTQLFVEWNHDKGYSLLPNTALRLQNIALAGVSIWSGNAPGPSLTMAFVPSAGVSVPMGDSNIVFTFDQEYQRVDGTERIVLQFANTGCGNYTVDSSVPSCPIPSTVVLSGSRSGNSFILNWTPSAEATSYLVYKSTDGTNFTLETTIAEPATTYTASITGTNGTVNYFKVQPINACGNGIDSNTITVVK